MSVSDFIAYEIELNETADDAEYLVECAMLRANAEIDIEVIATDVVNGVDVSTVRVSGHYLEMNRFSSRWDG